VSLKCYCVKVYETKGTPLYEAGPLRLYLVETRFLGNTSRSNATERRRKRARSPVVKLESCSACTRS
jgi:hypothetical protein